MNKSILFLAPILILFIGCASPRGDVEDKKEQNSDSLVANDIIPLLPSAGEFLGLVHDVGLFYDAKIINPLHSMDSYVLYRNQALNFGVYLSDFSYLLLFEKQAESIKYLYQIQEMSTMLGVESFFSDDFFNSLLENLSNPDSLKVISINQSTLFFNRMEAIGNKDLVLLISTGAIIEAMYISSNVVDENLMTDKVVDRVVDLAYVFDSFYLHYTLSSPKDEAINMLTEDIHELRSIFTSMAISQTSKAIRKDGKMILTSHIEHDVNAYNVKRMKVMVNAIRTKIVNQIY